MTQVQAVALDPAAVAELARQGTAALELLEQALSAQAERRVRILARLRGERARVRDVGRLAPRPLPEPPPGGELKSQHTLFGVGYRTRRGLRLQAPPWAEHAAAITSPVDYAVSQRLGAAMRAAGVEAFEYASARDQAGGERQGDGAGQAAPAVQPTPVARGHPQARDTDGDRCPVGGHGHRRTPVTDQRELGINVQRLRAHVCERSRVRIFNTPLTFHLA